MSRTGAGTRESALVLGHQLIEQLAGARLLLVVPHPDDESLALGGLIQYAVAAGAAITIVQVTNGDNNPWPQRWLERRWRIGSADRRRWGQRRNTEMLRAMECLGVAAEARRSLGWPDLGVTARLQRQGPGSVAPLATVLHEVHPDIVVFPALADRHPDHSACHVVTRLALRSLEHRPRRLTYQVHGRRLDDTRALALPLSAVMRERKRDAIFAHKTQIAMARRHLRSRVGAVETLYALPPGSDGARAAAARRVVALPWRPARGWHSRLRLTLAHPGAVHVWPWREAPLQPCRDHMRLCLPVAAQEGPWFARLETRGRSAWIFDHWGWCELTGKAGHEPAKPSR